MNVLAVGAHFDDLELGCGGALVKHARAGDNVYMLTVTHSGYMNPDGEVVREREVALGEGRRAAGIIGAEMICFDDDTFKVHFDESLTKRIQQVIDSKEIDTIYSHWDQDLHRDHMLTAQATLMAGRHMPRFLMYRSNYYVTGHGFNGAFYVDISETMDTKLEAIRSHDSELRRNNYSWLDFVEKQNRNHGRIIGVNYAECYRIVRYLV